jgi:hypothetical protein
MLGRCPVSQHPKPRPSGEERLNLDQRSLTKQHSRVRHSTVSAWPRRRSFWPAADEFPVGLVESTGVVYDVGGAERVVRWWTTVTA